MEGGCPHGRVLKFVICLQILLFLNKRSIVHFCGWGGGGSQNWSFFVAIIDVGPLNGLKLQPIQSLEAVDSSSTSSHKSDTF